MCPGGAKSSMSPVSVAFEVIERVTDLDSNPFLLPQIKVNTFWTNLVCTADEVIALYHDLGTSEQCHSELKSDLGIEQLPSGKISVNKIVMLCGMLAFNLLRTVSQGHRACALGTDEDQTEFFFRPQAGKEDVGMSFPGLGLLLFGSIALDGVGGTGPGSRRRPARWLGRRLGGSRCAHDRLRSSGQKRGDLQGVGGCFIVKGISGDQLVGQFHLSIGEKSASIGDFAVFFFPAGRDHAAASISHAFAIQGPAAGQCSRVGLQPSRQRVGISRGFHGGQQVVERVVTGHFEPSALLVAHFESDGLSLALGKAGDFSPDVHHVARSHQQAQ